MFNKKSVISFMYRSSPYKNTIETMKKRQFLCA